MNKGKNKYYNRSRISEKKFREIIKYFGYDETASKTAIYTSIKEIQLTKYLTRFVNIYLQII